jgi:hypothetical protein
LANSFSFSVAYSQKGKFGSSPSASLSSLAKSGISEPEAIEWLKAGSRWARLAAAGKYSVAS